MTVRGSETVVTGPDAARAAGGLTIKFRDGTVDAHVGRGVERGPAKAYPPKKPEQPTLF